MSKKKNNKVQHIDRCPIHVFSSLLEAGKRGGTVSKAEFECCQELLDGECACCPLHGMDKDTDTDTGKATTFHETFDGMTAIRYILEGKKVTHPAFGDGVYFALDICTGLNQPAIMMMYGNGNHPVLAHLDGAVLISVDWELVG